jgi:hypothetical protein
LPLLSRASLSGCGWTTKSESVSFGGVGGFAHSVAAGLQNLNLYHAHDFCIILIFSRNIALELPYQPLSS